MQDLKTSIEKAREEGIEEGVQKVALNLLQDGGNPKLVAKNTGLSLQEVEEVAKKAGIGPTAKNQGTNPHNNFFIRIFGGVDNFTRLLKLALGDHAERFDFTSLSFGPNTSITIDDREIRSDINAYVTHKETGKKTGIFFLVEHKAQKRPAAVLLQILGYLAAMLHQQQKDKGEGRPLEAIMPILVYNGKTKTYDGPKEFKELYVVEKIFQDLGIPILNFGHLLLNVHDPKLKNADQDHFFDLVFFAMRKIFDFKGKDRDENLKELFCKGAKLWSSPKKVDTFLRAFC